MWKERVDQLIQRLQGPHALKPIQVHREELTHLLLAVQRWRLALIAQPTPKRHRLARERPGYRS